MVFGKNEKLEQRFYNFRGPGGPVRIYLPTPRQLVSRPYNNIITSTRALVRIVHTHAHAPSTSIFSLLFFIYRTPSPPAPVYRNFVNIRSPSRRHVAFLHIYLFIFFFFNRWLWPHFSKRLVRSSSGRRSRELAGSYRGTTDIGEIRRRWPLEDLRWSFRWFRYAYLRVYAYVYYVYSYVYIYMYICMYTYV